MNLWHTLDTVVFYNLYLVRNILVLEIIVIKSGVKL